MPPAPDGPCPALPPLELWFPLPPPLELVDPPLPPAALDDVAAVTPLEPLVVPALPPAALDDNAVMPPLGVASAFAERLLEESSEHAGTSIMAQPNGNTALTSTRVHR